MVRLGMYVMNETIISIDRGGRHMGKRKLRGIITFHWDKSNNLYLCD